MGAVLLVVDDAESRLCVALLGGVATFVPVDRLECVGR